MAGQLRDQGSIPPLKPYQREGIAFLRAHPRALLGDEAGVGKTRQLIEAVRREPVLVVAPAHAQSVWEDEVAKWRPNLQWRFASYSSLCIRDGKNRVLPQPRAEYDGDWPQLIFDESHYLKGRNTNWTKAAQKLRADSTWLATGTPIVNWAWELWVNLRLLKPDDEFLRSYWRWARHWFKTWNPHYAPNAIKIGGLLECTRACNKKERCEHWERFYLENLDGYFLARRQDDVLPDLPPITEQRIAVEMTRRQAQVYAQLKRDYKVWVKELGSEIAAWSDGGLAEKLRQTTTGVGVAAGGTSFASGKLAALREELRSRPPPLVVFCWYQDTAEAVRQIVKAEGLSCAVRSGRVSRRARDLATRAFGRGEVDVLVGTLATTAESINELVRADTAIFIERSWRPSTNEQAVRRLRRLGQTRPVRILNFVSKGTVDERMLRILQTKTDQQMKALAPVEFASLL